MEMEKLIEIDLLPQVIEEQAQQLARANHAYTVELVKRRSLETKLEAAVQRAAETMAKMNEVMAQLGEKTELLTEALAALDVAERELSRIEPAEDDAVDVQDFGD